MKVITEERLRERFEESQHKYLKAPLERIYEPNAVMNTLHELIDECQELDTLTVTRLRPMSDAPDHEYSLFVHKEGRRPTEGYKNDLSIVIDGEPIPSACFAGWIPMPRYEPENV